MSTGRRAYDILRGYVNREWDRIQGIDWTSAEAELMESLRREPSPAQPVPVAVGKIEDKETTARKILGVAPDADFSAVRAAFERLIKRIEGAEFAEGSPEAARLAEIQREVHWAYAVLSDGVDDTAKRFQSLEID